MDTGTDIEPEAKVARTGDVTQQKQTGKKRRRAGQEEQEQANICAVGSSGTCDVPQHLQQRALKARQLDLSAEQVGLGDLVLVFVIGRSAYVHLTPF